MGHHALEVVAPPVPRRARRPARRRSSGGRTRRRSVVNHDPLDDAHVRIPAGCGGVGDYTAQVAAALVAAGDAVTVFCPPRPADSRDSRAPSSGQAGVEVVVLDDVYGRLSRRAIDERLNRLIDDPVDNPGSVRADRVRPARSEHSLVPLAPRALAPTWVRRAGDVSRALLRVHLEPPPAECPRRGRARDGEDAAARRVTRLPVDRRVAPIPDASHAGRTAAGARHVADSVGDSSLRHREPTSPIAARAAGVLLDAARRPLRHVRLGDRADARTRP